MYISDYSFDVLLWRQTLLMSLELVCFILTAGKYGIEGCNFPGLL